MYLKDLASITEWIDPKLRNTSDFESEITMNDISYPTNVTMHRISKSLDKENPSTSRVSTSIGAVILHENIVELDNCRDANKLDGSGKKDKPKEPLPEIACHQCRKRGTYILWAHIKDLVQNQM